MDTAVRKPGERKTMSDNTYQTQNDTNDVAFLDINRSQRLSLRKSAPIYNFAERNPIPEETPGNTEDVEVRNVSGRRSISNVTSYLALSFIQENMIAEEQKKVEEVVLNTRYDGDIPYVREEEWESVFEALKVEGNDQTGSYVEENVEESQYKEGAEDKVDEEIVVSRLEPLKEYPILQRMPSIESILDKEDDVGEATNSDEVDDANSRGASTTEKDDEIRESIKEVSQESAASRQSKRTNITEEATDSKSTNGLVDKLLEVERVQAKEEEETSSNKRHTICFEPKKAPQRRKWSTSSHSAVADLENIHYVNGSTQAESEESGKKSKGKKNGVKKFLSAIFGSSRSKKQKKQKTVKDK